MLNRAFGEFDQDTSGFVIVVIPATEVVLNLVYLHRYIEKSELGALCAILNTQMSDAELVGAMDRLDTDNSGRIELVRCSNYVFGYTLV